MIRGPGCSSGLGRGEEPSARKIEHRGYNTATLRQQFGHGLGFRFVLALLVYSVRPCNFEIGYGLTELASGPLRLNADVHAPCLEKAPETFYSRIPVLATLQAVEHGAQRLFTRRLVLFEAMRFSCQACDALCEAGATLRGEYAPAEEPVGVFEGRVLFAAVDMALEQRVQSLSFLQ